MIEEDHGIERVQVQESSKNIVKLPLISTSFDSIFNTHFLKLISITFFLQFQPWITTPLSIEALQVSAKKKSTRTSYVLNNSFHQFYLILECKWSLSLILDSCRFLTHKNQIFILSRGGNSVRCWVCFGATTSYHIVVVVKLKFKLIPKPFSKWFLLLLWLMFDLMN